MMTFLLFAPASTLMSRNACNGENGKTGEKSPAAGDLNWMPKVAPWSCHFCHFCQIRHFRQNRHLAKGPFAISFEFFVYSLAILAIKRHFCHFRPIRHFRQNRHLAKDPFAISFEFLFIVWRFWRLIAISAIFANACISGHISASTKWFRCRMDRKSRRDCLGRFCDIYCAVILRYSLRVISDIL